MSQKDKATDDAGARGDAGASDGLPSWMPEELLPVCEWCRRHGNLALILLAVAALLAAGALFARHHRESRRQEASSALLAAESIESLETLAGRYGRTRVGPLIRLRLAKAYYDAGKYDEALKAYEAFLARDGRHEMADIARLGRAAALEGRRDFDAALKAYEEFAKANPDHYLLPLAVMGQARCLAARGDKPRALDLLVRLAVARADTPWEDIAADLRRIIERFEGLRTVSLFDRLDAARSAGEQPATAVDIPEIPAVPVPPAAATNESAADTRRPVGEEAGAAQAPAGE